MVAACREEPARGEIDNKAVVEKANELVEIARRYQDQGESLPEKPKQQKH